MNIVPPPPLNLALLIKAKRVLGAQPFVDAFTPDLHLAMTQRSNPLLDEWRRYAAIDAWRRRFSNPSNNPFA